MDKPFFDVVLINGKVRKYRDFDDVDADNETATKSIQANSKREYINTYRQSREAGASIVESRAKAKKKLRKGM